MAAWSTKILGEGGRIKTEKVFHMMCLAPAVDAYWDLPICVFRLISIFTSSGDLRVARPGRGPAAIVIAYGVPSFLVFCRSILQGDESSVPTRLWKHVKDERGENRKLIYNRDLLAGLVVADDRAL